MVVAAAAKQGREPFATQAGQAQGERAVVGGWRKWLHRGDGRTVAAQGCALQPTVLHPVHRALDIQVDCRVGAAQQCLLPVTVGHQRHQRRLPVPGAAEAELKAEQHTSRVDGALQGHRQRLYRGQKALPEVDGQLRRGDVAHLHSQREEAVALMEGPRVQRLGTCSGVLLLLLGLQLGEIAQHPRPLEPDPLTHAYSTASQPYCDPHCGADKGGRHAGLDLNAPLCEEGGGYAKRRSGSHHCHHHCHGPIHQHGQAHHGGHGESQKCGH
mmetsp:Transcript_5706/g.15990  ORF Transcript_5706/g.15990 Transcript_5706/m.15990 type:complete len:270 (-) Transcript_5706:1111-1920(-)